MDLIVSLDNGLFTRYDDKIQHFVENRINIRCKSGNNKTYSKTCATSDQRRLRSDFDQSFVDHMCLLRPPGHPKKHKREPLLGRWSHRSYCRFCRALLQDSM